MVLAENHPKWEKENEALVEEYIEENYLGRKPRTIRKIRQRILIFANTYVKKNIEEITKEELTKFVDDLDRDKLARVYKDKKTFRRCSSFNLHF